MPGIDELRRQQAEWAGKGVGGGNFKNLYPKQDDMIFFYFVWTGLDGDPYFDTFTSHEFPAPVGSKRWGDLRFCPVESGVDVNYDCIGCREGMKLKPRMGMWLYVTDHLMVAQPEGETLPLVTYNGRGYYQRAVNAARFWETSAWRDSPLNEIIFIGENLVKAGQTMHANQWVMNPINKSLDRRFKLYQMTGFPPFSADLYQQALLDCTPVKELMMSELKQVPVAAAPEAYAAPAFAPAMSAVPSVTPAPLSFQMAPPQPAAVPQAFSPSAAVQLAAPAEVQAAVHAAAAVPFDTSAGQTQNHPPAAAVAAHIEESVAPLAFRPVTAEEAVAFTDAPPAALPSMAPAGNGRPPALPNGGKSLF